MIITKKDYMYNHDFFIIFFTIVENLNSTRLNGLYLGCRLALWGYDPCKHALKEKSQSILPYELAHKI